MKLENRRLAMLLILSTIFYGGMFAIFGLGIFYDSQQYIDMHIHREPGYCLFLWAIRQIVGDIGISLWIAGLLQTVLVVAVTGYVVNDISTEFELNKKETFLLLLLQFVPHVVTVLMSENDVVFNSGILSESIAYPLFQLFIICCYKMMYDSKQKPIIICAIVAFLLAITRSQFMIAFLMWFLLLVIKYVIKKEYKKIFIVTLFTIALFVGRSYLMKSYNYIFNEKHFIAGTYGGVNTLTNVLYASDREDGERITSEVSRELFYQMYDEMVNRGWSKENSEKGFLNQAIFIEQNHDNIKFEVLDKCYLYGLDALGYKDYYEQNIEADRISMEIIKEILPSCWSVWLINYLILGFRGMMRCIGIVHPVIGIVVWGMYLLGFGLCFYRLFKNKWSKEGWILFIALLAVLALSFSTAITIMCLSRYMIYGFVPFYTALFLNMREQTKTNKLMQ